MCLAFIDIDRFKKINDKYGHDLGDKFLKSLVVHFNDILRNMDMVYRWGGEEFIILLPETSLDRALVVCERIREDVEKNMVVEQHRITISLGVTQLRAAESIQTMVQRADGLLYKAKQSGRNRIIGE
ncbi:GGDEF domain-containing protein [Psychromonas sp. MME2]|uniref:GGDEF domain-containing protein n=1 Tax=Psychromonas sp. MME2 TaxID=3231033 RepID=UPI00339BC9EE